MTFNEFITFYLDIESSISQNRLFDVIRRIKLLCDKMTEAELSSRISNVERTYFYLLDYFITGADDPSRADMILKLKNELYSINDELLRRLVLSKQQYPLYSGSLFQEQQIILNESEDISSMFYSIAYSDYPRSNDKADSIKSLILSSSISVGNKSMLLSALFLSQLRLYSEPSINLFIQVYCNTDFDIKLRIKSLIYFYFLCYRYSHRISLSKEIMNEVSIMTSMRDYPIHLSLIILQHLRCRNSDSLNAKVEKEIMPEIMKLSPKIKGINKKNITIDDMLEANPEWEKMMQDSDISSALKDISEFQFDGADIFLNTFKQLRHHIFFNKVHNWFSDFDTNSTDSLGTALPDELKTVLSDAIMISDTDKFTLALSMSGIGEDMKQMMIRSFREQADVWMQYNSSKDKDINSLSKIVVRNVMQDLYRFFKFVGLGKCVRNPFDYMPLSDENLIIANSTLPPSEIKVCADYLLKYNNYKSAIDFYNILLENSESPHEVYQKIGFCYQSLSDYPLAIEYYKKAEILSPDNSWILTRLAQCYKSLSDYDSALTYYKRISELKPDNLGVILNIGHVLLAQDKLSDALHYYYQADFISGGIARTLRPIAWCEFLRDDYEKSEKYYLQIPDSDKTYSDFLNMGHLYFVQSDFVNAEKSYINSLKKLNGDINAFTTNFIEDESTLLQKKLNRDEIYMMLDRVCFSYSKEKN